MYRQQCILDAVMLNETNTSRPRPRPRPKIILKSTK